MTVREYVQRVNEVLGTPDLAGHRIVQTVSVGQDFGSGDELSAVVFYLDSGRIMGTEVGDAVCVADARCEEG
jgi:hypothetical protein